MADTKQITVQGFTVNVSTPYAEGHACSAAEAAALNQVRAENIRNNKAKLAKDLKDEFGIESAEATSTLQAEITKYDGEYEFTLASVGGGRSTMTPVEKEAKAIAREYIKSQLAELGKTQKQYLEENGEDAIKTKLAEFAQHPEIVKMAEKNIAAREKNSSLADAIKL